MQLPLCVRVDARDKRSCDALSADGWRRIETLLTFEGPRPPLYTGSGLERGTEKSHLLLAQNIADATGRLFADPEIKIEDAWVAKRQWIADAWERGDFWVFENSGFIAFRNGNIVDMICVKGGHKKQGIGSWLLSMAQSAELRAGTAETNIEAVMFYVNLGWRLMKKEATYHKSAK